MNDMADQLISAHRGLFSKIGGKIGQNSQQGHSESVVEFVIPSLRVAPQLAFLLVIFRGSPDQKHHGCNRHYLVQVDEHIFAYILVQSAPVLRRKQVDHDPVHPDLLVNPAEHHLFIDRLVIPADGIMIQVDIHVIELLTVRQRLEGKDIVDVESMLRQLHPAFSQFPPRHSAAV